MVWHNQLSLRTKILVLSAIVFVLLELIFDPIEIVLGELLLLTNSIRPKVGRLWTEVEKDLAGSNDVALIASSIESDSITESVHNLSDLRAILDDRDQVVISRENFLSIYKQIPPEKASAIIDPLDLMEIDHNYEWENTRFETNEYYLQIYLLDASGQVLYDSYPKRDILNPQTGSEPGETTLQLDPAFKGRVISAESFLSAFDQLSRSLRVQVMNNPYKLVQWGDNLKHVAISRYVENGVVEIAFEVQANRHSTVYRFQASELAIAHLITKLNEQDNKEKITLPKEKSPN